MKKARRWALVLGAVSPWIFIVADRADDPAKWDVSRWAAWRDEQIGAILTPSLDSRGEKVLSRAGVVARSSAAYDQMRPFLQSTAFLADPARRKAMGNFVRFVTAQHWMSIAGPAGVATNGLGMDLSDREYWSFARPYLQFPDLLQSQSFLKSLGSPSSYQAAVGTIDVKNASLPDDRKWLVLPFRAQFIRSVDRTTYGRLLVVVPNERMADGKILDRWVMFAIATPDMGSVPEIKSVSMVSTLRDPAKPGQSWGYMADFLRETDFPTGTISIRPNFLLTPNPSKNCYECHKAAVLPIRPKLAYRFDAGGKMVDEPAGWENKTNTLDGLIDRYGISEFGHFDTGGYGPTLGGAQRLRSDEFIAQATRDLPLSRASYQRIRESMRCGTCHESFGSLNYPLAVQNDRDATSFEAKEGLVKTFIEKGYMPPHNRLSTEERTALWRCLTKEYFDGETQSGTFVDWLRGKESV